MKKLIRRKATRQGTGQTAMEYLLLLATMTIIALVATRNMLPDAVQQVNGHFNLALTNFVGSAPKTSMTGPFPTEGKF